MEGDDGRDMLDPSFTLLWQASNLGNGKRQQTWQHNQDENSSKSSLKVRHQNLIPTWRRLLGSPATYYENIKLELLGAWKSPDSS